MICVCVIVTSQNYEKMKLELFKLENELTDLNHKKKLIKMNCNTKLESVN